MCKLTFPINESAIVYVSDRIYTVNLYSLISKVVIPIYSLLICSQMCTVMHVYSQALHLSCTFCINNMAVYYHNTQFTMHATIIYNFIGLVMKISYTTWYIDERPKALSDFWCAGLLLSQSHCIPCSYSNMVRWAIRDEAIGTGHLCTVFQTLHSLNHNQTNVISKCKFILSHRGI